MLKGMTKHEDKEHRMALKHEALRRINHKATQNKNNTETTALERSKSDTYTENPPQIVFCRKYPSLDGAFYVLYTFLKLISPQRNWWSTYGNAIEKLREGFGARSLE